MDKDDGQQVMLAAAAAGKEAVAGGGQRFQLADYKRDLKPVWCTGCGDYGVLQSIYRALTELNRDPAAVAIISGIGCSSRLPGYVNVYGFNAVHGRALPIAQGLKLARPDITVMAVGGDGDGLSIGMGHFPHAARRNVDMTYVMMDNFIYGLTKGQVSPTTPHGDVTVSTPYGSVDHSLDPVKLALAFNVSFIARGFAGDLKHLTDLITAAVRHPGFSFVHVISPCTTFRGMDEFKRIRGQLNYVEATPDELISSNSAYAREEQNQGKINLGLLYRRARPTFSDEFNRLAAPAREALDHDLAMQSLLNEFLP
jgi:2-oxoglutarate ferredoxin oxidoreductase subunit beta